MFIRSLELRNYRSWEELSLHCEAGITVFSGPNGQGKTNIVEALIYLAHLQSHRVSHDSALVREGVDIAHLSATAVHQGRELTASLAMRAQGRNRAYINRSMCSHPREILGIIHTVSFAPEDLAILRGEPEQRRQFLDSVITARYPRLSAVKSDYDKALRQRNALLKQSSYDLKRGYHSDAGKEALATLDIWDAQLASLGAQIIASRLHIIEELSPYLKSTYQHLAPHSRPVSMNYHSTLDALFSTTDTLDIPAIEALLLESFSLKREQEIDRGTTLIGPHRDDLHLFLGSQPAKGFASHGESWSYVLALKLATFYFHKDHTKEPIIILDDVFAELDSSRRQQLVSLAQEAEQVFITAAVNEDIPQLLRDEAKIYYVRAVNREEGRISEISESPYDLSEEITEEITNG